VIIPVFNEEKNIVKTLASLLRVSYSKIEVLVVNDGSSDNSSIKIKNFISKLDDSNVKLKFIDNKENKGKAHVLNQAISVAKGEIVAILDADTIVEKKIFNKIINYYSNSDVAAVVVSIFVENPKNLLQKMIDVEYSIMLSLFQKIFSFFDSIFVTPGQFSTYRKSIFKKIGGFDVNNIAEDNEIAFRIHEAGFKIKMCFNARAFTLVPNNFKEFYIQRRRWYFGAIQTFVKHINMFFNRKFFPLNSIASTNLFLIALGLILFIMFIVNSVIGFIGYYFGLGFSNPASHLFLNALFILIIGILGLIVYLTSVILVRKTHSLKVKNSLFAIFLFPFLFILYQFFWLSAFYHYFKDKKIPWR